MASHAQGEIVSGNPIYFPLPFQKTRQGMTEINRKYLYITIFFLFVFLVLRTIGLYPICFSDEYQYSILSRIQPLSEAHLPNYLYLKNI